MVVYNARKYRERQRRTSRRRWLFAGGLLLLAVLALARCFTWPCVKREEILKAPPMGPAALLVHPLKPLRSIVQCTRRNLRQRHGVATGSDSLSAFPGSALDHVHRRTLQEVPQTAASKRLEAWRLLVLTPQPASADWQRAALESGLKGIAEPFALVWQSGSQAAGLAQYLGLTALPGAVLLPPFCNIRTCQGPDLPVVFRPREAAIAPANALAAWMRRTGSAWLLLANDSGQKVKFSRQPANTDADADADAESTETQDLDSGDRKWISTPLQATWTAVYAEGDGKVLATREVRGDALMTVRPPDECNFFTQPGCEVPRPDKHFSDEILKAREEANLSRLEDIRNQSAAIPHYTTAGYEKRRAPPELFAALHAYFEAHAVDYAREDWEDDDIFVNHDQAQFLLVDIPEAGPMRPAIFEALKGIFETWAGGAQLEPTAIYGVRVYTRGAVLRDHVDVAETHHISAIINVDQDVDEPWPLEIIDHEGVTHQAELAPGEMLLYEGATCAHGRPKPLNGNWMANIFVHMRPAGLPADTYIV